MKLYLAPMEGITTHIYRTAYVSVYGGIDRFFTPFLTESHLKGRSLREVLPDNNRGFDLVPQVLTDDTRIFLSIAKQLGDMGYTEMNLNLGCPSGTVTSKGHGSGFLARYDELEGFLDEIYSKSPINISIKTRIGFTESYDWEHTLEYWGTLIELFNKYPVSELIVHPRLRSDFYSGEVHMDAFRLAMEKSKLPLCYNGDVRDMESFCRVEGQLSGEAGSKADIKAYTCESIPVMIGRGVIANPELPMQLRRLAKGECEDTGITDRKKLREFLSLLMDGYGQELQTENAVLMKMKELWGYLGPSLGMSKDRLKDILKSKSIAEYKSYLGYI